MWNLIQLLGVFFSFFLFFFLWNGITLNSLICFWTGTTHFWVVIFHAGKNNDNVLAFKMFLAYLCDELGHCQAVQQLLFNKLFSPGELSTCLHRLTQPRYAQNVSSKHVAVPVHTLPRTAFMFPFQLYVNKTQTHKRFRRTLFIRTKHNIQIFGVIPFIKLQNKVKWWKMRWRAKPLIHFWSSYVVFMSSAWKNVIMIISKWAFS